MDPSRLRCTTHGALYEAMVHGIVNVREPLCYFGVFFQLLLHRTISYHTFFSGYVMTLRKKMHLEDYVQWYCSLLFSLCSKHE